MTFRPTAYGTMVAPSPMPDAVSGEPASCAVQALPGGDGDTLIITNLGPSAAVVRLGDSNVTVTFGAGMAIPPNTRFGLTVVEGSTHLAAIGTQDRCVLNLARGTES